MNVRIEHATKGPPDVHIDLETASDNDVRVRDALALLGGLTSSNGIWVHGTDEQSDAAMRSEGFASDRTLLQMRRALPTETGGLDTEPLDLSADLDIAELVEVNNRAFAWHPEQAGLTIEAARDTFSEAWFDPDGVRLVRRNESLAGFCWTKIHDSPERIGEIYVICVDPAFHGQGLGRPLTLAGLEWLSGRGLEAAMLYVESDNLPAVRTYESLGFVTTRFDKLWHR